MRGFLRTKLFLDWSCLDDERHTQVAEERFCLRLRLSRGDDGDCETEDVLEVFIGGLREYGHILDADGVVPHVVYRLGRETAEVARTRKSDVDHLVDEVIHACAAERHLHADRIAFTHLERCDGHTCATKCRLLAGDLREAVLDELELFLVALLPHASRNDDLAYARALHRARVSKSLRECEIGRLLFLFGGRHMLFLRVECGLKLGSRRDERDVRDVNRTWALRDVPDLPCTTLHVTFRYSYAIDDDLIFLRQGTRYDAGLPFVLACYYFHFVSFFYVHIEIIRRLQRRW